MRVLGNPVVLCDKNYCPTRLKAIGRLKDSRETYFNVWIKVQINV